MADAVPRRINWPRLFGYDFFVSFKLGTPPRGAQSYASDLARTLRERGFQVFFSEQELSPGDALRPSLLSALRRSRSLVVICTESVLTSPGWVKTEVDEFRRTRRGATPIVINVGAALQQHHQAQRGSTEWLTSNEHVWIDESCEAVEAGLISGPVADRLAVRPVLHRANTWLRFTVGAVAISLSVLAITATWQATIARHQRDQALTEKARAELALAHSDIATAQDLIARDDAERSIPYLERAMLLDPSRTSTAMQLTSLMLDRPRPRLLERLPNSKGAVVAMAYSHDGLLLAVASHDTIQLWSTTEHREIFRRSVADGLDVTHIEFSPDGQWLTMSAGNDGGAFGQQSARGEVYLWDLQTPETAPRVIPVQGMLWSAKFSPEDAAVVSASALSIEAWPLQNSGKSLWKIELHQLNEQLPDFSLSDNSYTDFTVVDGAIVVACGVFNGALARWDRQSKRFTAAKPLPQAPGPLAVSRSRNNVLLVLPNKNLSMFSRSNDRRGTAIAVDTRTLNFSSNAMQSGDLLSAATVLPHDQLYVTAAHDGTLKFWTTQGGQPLATVRHREAIIALDSSADGLQVASGSKDGVVRLWNTLELAIHTNDIVHEQAIAQLRFSPSGQRLATATIDGEIRIWDVSPSPALPMVVSTQDPPVGVMTSADGTMTAVTARSGKTVLWNMQEGRAVWEAAGSGSVTLAAEGPRDRWYLARGQKLGIVDLAGQASIADVEVGGSITQIAFDSKGEKVLAATEKGVVNVRDARNLSPLKRLNSNGSVSSAIFLGNGNIVSASGDTLTVWNGASGEILRSTKSATLQRSATFTQEKKFVRDPAEIVDLALASDGRHFLVSYGGEGTVVGVSNIRNRYFIEQVEIWDSETLELKTPLSVAGTLTKVEISPSRRWVAIGTESGVVRVWSTTDGSPRGADLLHTGAIQHLAFADNDSRLAVADSASRLSIWQRFSETDRPVSLPLNGAMQYLTARPGMLFTLNTNGTIEIRDSTTGQRASAPIQWLPTTDTLAISRSGARLTAASKDGYLATWHFPLPTTFQTRCAMARAARTVAGYRIISGGDPLPRMTDNKVPIDLSEKCLGHRDVAISDFESWLTIKPGTRPLHPGSSVTPHEMFTTLLRTNDSAGITSMLAMRAMSEPCARLAVARHLQNTDVPEVQKIGTFVQSANVEDARVCYSN